MTRAQLLRTDCEPTRRALLPRPVWSNPFPAEDEGRDLLVCARFFNRYGVEVRGNGGDTAVGPSALLRYADLTSLDRPLTEAERGEFEALQHPAAEELGRTLEERLLNPLRQAIETLSRLDAQGHDHEAPTPDHVAPRSKATKKARPRR